MGDPMKVMKKPRIHPIIQIMAQEWKAAEVEQHMPNWGIFTLDYISDYYNAQQEAHTDWHLHLSTVNFTVYLQGIPDDRHWWITSLPPPQGDPPTPPFMLGLQHHLQYLAEVPSHIWGEIGAYGLSFIDDNIIGTGLTDDRGWDIVKEDEGLALLRMIRQLRQSTGSIVASLLHAEVETQFLAIAARLFTAAMAFSAHLPDDGQQAYLMRKVKDEIILVGNQFKKFMGDPSKHTKKPCMHPIIQILSGGVEGGQIRATHARLGHFHTGSHIWGLQNHRQWWVTGLPPPHSDVDVAMEVMAAPAQPSAPISAAPTMPDVPATSKGKAHALPPAGLSDPYGTLPTSNAQPDVPYAFRHARCGTCKNPKVNNAEYLDLPPGVEATYGPSAVGTSSISPDENLKSHVNSLEAKMDYAIMVLNALAGIQGIIPSSLPGYTQLPPACRSASPSYHSLSSPGLAITSLRLTDSPSESQSRSSSRSDNSDTLLKYNVGEAPLHLLHTSKAEVLETRVACQLSSNEIFVSHLVYVSMSLIIWHLARHRGPRGQKFSAATHIGGGSALPEVGVVDCQL
ncbi:hypothetical protein EI94DRAFT_1706980 [Lactarius quietus]|nr:hypothetical protein EI94DRAFT_1706980 [Lactarius quietus]